MRKHYSAAFKAQVVREILREAKSINQLATDYGVHPNQLYRWRDHVLAGLPGLLSDQAAQDQAAREAAHARQLDELYAEIGKLTTQLAWLKKKAGHLAE